MVKAIGILWFLLLAIGVTVFMRFENRAGLAASAPSDWPADSRIQRATDRPPTLIMLAHPRCSCTRASLSELERVMTELNGRVSAHVVFINPDGADAEWTNTDLWERAAAIPNVNVLRDNHGVEAARFDSKTSGQTMLYDADGKLMFKGGITIGRGLEGDSLGSQTIVSIVNGEASPLGDTNVYGCPLFATDPNADQRTEATNARSKH